MHKHRPLPGIGCCLNQGAGVVRMKRAFKAMKYQTKVLVVVRHPRQVKEIPIG
jgi:hypothetical protein